MNPVSQIAIVVAKFGNFLLDLSILVTAKMFAMSEVIMIFEDDP